jgi:hypothetical protein
MPLSIEVCIWGPWQRTWVRVIIVLVVFLLTGRLAPGQVDSLGLGGLLGGWLAVGWVPAPQLARAREA